MAIDKTFNDVKVNMTLQPQSVRANLLSTQEDLAVQMGKIQKWYDDLRHEAFDGTYYDDLLVTSKTFTNVLSTNADSDAACIFYLIKARQSSWDTPAILRYRIHIYCPDHLEYNTYADVTLFIHRGASSYLSQQTFYSTSYRPVYYHYWGRLTAAGYSNANNYSNIAGISLRYSNNSATTGYQRTIEIQVLEHHNCTFEFFDTATLYANVPGTGSTNYNVTNAGFTGTGVIPDSNTYDRTYLNERPYAGSNGVKQYSLCAYNKDGKLESFTTSSGTGTSKAYYTAGQFQYKPNIYYYSGSGNIAANALIAASCIYPIITAFDMRYSANVTTSAGFTSYKCVYLEIEFDADGYWHPTTTGFTQTLTSGNYYIFMGVAPNTYQISLQPQHPVFYYDGTNLIDADLYRAQQSIPSDTITGTGTVGSIAKFTDTHEIGDATWTPNTPTTCNISQGVLTFTAGTAASLS